MKISEQVLLQVKSLTTVFNTAEGQFRAVDQVSFDLRKGTILGIVGESGSGKSVAALSIMQLIQSSSGKITEGEVLFTKNETVTDLLKLPNREKRNYRGKDIAMIFQEPMTSLNPVLSCGYQVAEALILHLNLSKKEAKERTIDLFKKVQLPRPDDIYNSYPHQLSGGQKQRVLIAMAISCSPAVLIADEPTTALDVTVQAAILDLLKELQYETGMSIIFITHDLAVVSKLAQHVLVMYKGKAVEQGKAKDIFSNPQHAYTKGLLACRPSLNRQQVKLPVISDFMEVDDAGVIKEKKRDAKDSLSHISVNVEKEESRLTSIYADKPLLCIQELAVHFPLKGGFFGKEKGIFKAVDGVSFNIYKGETLGLVGESGCGKTTLGRAILKLTESTSGVVIYKEQDLLKMPASQLRPLRKDLQMIFQDPYASLNPRMMIGDAIIEPMKVHRLYNSDKERKERVFWLLEKVNLLPSHFYRFPHEFSGGQRQRIGIARALSMNPEFIICDESVSALDVSVQAQVLNLLNDLKREFNFTYIFISHDLAVVKFMSDRLMVMQDGKIIEEGNPEEIYRSPKSVYTKKLIDAIPGF